MTQPFRFIFRGLVGLALASGAAGAGCASLDAGMAGVGGCFGAQCLDAGYGGSGDGMVMETGTSDASQDADATPINPLCATGCSQSGTALPDDENACAGVLGGAAGAGPGDSGPGGDATPSVEAGAAPDSGTPDAGEASTGQPPQGDAATPDAGAATPPSRYGCHLVQNNGTPAAVCEPAGEGKESKPCVDSGDCAPGYGCSAGECRHFCCAGNSACECDPDAGTNCDPGLVGTFCADRPLETDDTGAGSPQTPQMAPVCVPADNCNLAEPYPCQASNPDDCTCPEPGTACMVVGDGLTSCITPPGTGKAGDACPCAWGHVCSQATGKCLKICSLTANDPGCGGGKCQASKQMPDYFGVCVPSAATDGGY